MFSFSFDMNDIRRLWGWLQTNICRKSFPDYNSSPLNEPKRKKEEYIERYKKLIDNLQSLNEIIPTNWAWVTDAGIIEYEKSIRRKPEYDEEKGMVLLDNLSLEIAAKINTEKITSSNNVAFMVYGCGNSMREQYVIDKICRSIGVAAKKQSAVKVIFIDISYYYISQHYWSRTLDQSEQKYNQLFKLLDFIYDKDEIKKLREGLKKSKVIHLFMGNIAGNYEEQQLRSICQEYTLAGDYLLMEYGEYDFPKMQSDDYQHAFATEAVKEMYQKKAITDITTKTIISQKRSHIKIKFSLNDSVTKEINSFLRRNFDPKEFSKGKFSTEEDIESYGCGETPCGQGKRKITLFCRRS